MARCNSEPPCTKDRYHRGGLTSNAEVTCIFTRSSFKYQRLYALLTGTTVSLSVHDGCTRCLHEEGTPQGEEAEEELTTTPSHSPHAVDIV